MRIFLAIKAIFRISITLLKASFVHCFHHFLHLSRWTASLPSLFWGPNLYPTRQSALTHHSQVIITSFSNFIQYPTLFSYSFPDCFISYVINSRNTKSSFVVDSRQRTCSSLLILLVLQKFLLILWVLINKLLHTEQWYFLNVHHFKKIIDIKHI